MTEESIAKGAASSSTGFDRASRSGSMTDRTRLAIPLALAVVTSVFIVLGIQGTILSRLLRNEPIAVAAAFAVSIFGLALPLFWMWTKGRGHSISQAVGAALVLLGATLAVVVGASSFSEREHPQLNFIGTLTEDNLVRLKATAAAPTLKSNEKMLLRVTVVPAEALDGTQEKGMLEMICKDNTQPPRSNDELPESLRKLSTVLFWGETGPDSEGIAANEVTLLVSRKDFAYACVVAALSGRDQTSENRYSWTVIDLRSIDSEVL